MRNVLTPFLSRLTLGSLFAPLPDAEAGLLLLTRLGRPFRDPIRIAFHLDAKHSISRARTAYKAPGLKVDPRGVRKLCGALARLSEGRSLSAVFAVGKELARASGNLNLSAARAGFVMALAIHRRELLGHRATVALPRRSGKWRSG